MSALLSGIIVPFQTWRRGRAWGSTNFICPFVYLENKNFPGTDSISRPFWVAWGLGSWVWTFQCSRWSEAKGGLGAVWLPLLSHPTGSAIFCPFKPFQLKFHLFREKTISYVSSFSPHVGIHEYLFLVILLCKWKCLFIFFSAAFVLLGTSIETHL